MFLDIFNKAGLKIKLESKQPNFPKDMFGVIAYGLI